MITATATEVKNKFGYYLQSVIEGNEVIILKNGKEVARLISNNKAVSYLTDSLIGVLKNDYDDKKIKAEKITKYENLR